jgi:hypothetical protein
MSTASTLDPLSWEPGHASRHWSHMKYVLNFCQWFYFRSNSPLQFTKLDYNKANIGQLKSVGILGIVWHIHVFLSWKATKFPSQQPESEIFELVLPTDEKHFFNFFAWLVYFRSKFSYPSLWTVPESLSLQFTNRLQQGEYGQLSHSLKFLTFTEFKKIFPNEDKFYDFFAWPPACISGQSSPIFGRSLKVYPLRFIKLDYNKANINQLPHWNSWPCVFLGR